MRNKIWRWMRIAALAATASLVLGSVAWGDDGYYYRHDEAREHGYRNGYRDGLRTGQHDSERGRRLRFKNDQWEDAHGYEHWMGSHGRYKHFYREGYEEGYRRAYGYGYRRDWDRDGYRHDWDRDGWR